MSIKSIVVSQYRKKANDAASQLQGMNTPPEGWICTARKALGMSAAALARRLGKSRALVSNTEKSELDGGVTLKTMKAMADAMQCRFVYAIVPEHNIETVLKIRANKKAKQSILEASKHMALEEQSLSPQQLAFEIERLSSAMLRQQPNDFWNDEPLS